MLISPILIEPVWSSLDTNPSLPLIIVSDGPGEGYCVSRVAAATPNPIRWCKGEYRILWRIFLFYLVNPINMHMQLPLQSVRLFRGLMTCCFETVQIVATACTSVLVSPGETKISGHKFGVLEFEETSRLRLQEANVCYWQSARSQKWSVIGDN